MDGDQLLFPGGGDSHQHQHAALAVLSQADIEMNAVGPQVDVLSAFQRASIPIAVFRFPDPFEPRDRRGGQAGTFRAQQRLERLAEAARADSLEVEPRNQLFDALGLSQVGRQEPRAEFLPLRRRPPIMHPRLLDLNLADAGRDRAFGKPPVANHLPAALLVDEVRARSNPLGDFRFDCRGQHPLGCPKQSCHGSSKNSCGAQAVPVLVASTTCVPQSTPNWTGPGVSFSAALLAPTYRMK